MASPADTSRKLLTLTHTHTHTLAYPATSRRASFQIFTLSGVRDVYQCNGQLMAFSVHSPVHSPVLPPVLLAPGACNYKYNNDVPHGVMFLCFIITRMHSIPSGACEEGMGKVGKFCLACHARNEQIAQQLMILFLSFGNLSSLVSFSLFPSLSLFLFLSHFCAALFSVYLDRRARVAHKALRHLQDKPKR